MLNDTKGQVIEMSSNVKLFIFISPYIYIYIYTMKSYLGTENWRTFTQISFSFDQKLIYKLGKINMSAPFHVRW